MKPNAMLQAAALLAAACPAWSDAAVTIVGSATAQAGNAGNPAVQQTVTGNANGSYAVGPLSGPQFGGNSTQGSFTVASQPEPGFATFATGADNGLFDANGATTFISVSYTFDFSIVGPLSGIGVPIRFSGGTLGTASGSGDAARWNNRVGTRLEVTSVGGVFGFAAVGPQTGTAADIFGSSSQDVRAAWGNMASGPVNYTSYDASFLFGATVLTGQFASGQQVLKLATILQGGTAGTLHHNGLPSSGTVQSMLDAFIFIDPAWAAAHPGYQLVLDPGVGVGPVPLPPSGTLMLAGLGAIGAWLRRRRSGRVDRLGPCGG